MCLPSSPLPQVARPPGTLPGSVTKCCPCASCSFSTAAFSSHLRPAFSDCRGKPSRGSLGCECFLRLIFYRELLRFWMLCLHVARLSSPLLQGSFRLWPTWSPFLHSLSVFDSQLPPSGCLPQGGRQALSSAGSRAEAGQTHLLFTRSSPLLPVSSCEGKPGSPNTLRGSEVPLGLDPLRLGAFVSWDDSHPRMSHQQLKGKAGRSLILGEVCLILGEKGFFRFVLLSINLRVSGLLRVITSVDGDLGLHKLCKQVRLALNFMKSF